MTPRCLDLTRLISRVGRGPMTGVDRVELAYLRELLRRSDPLWLLVRTGLGFVLLDRDGAEEIRARLEGERPWGPADLAGLLSRKSPPEKRRAEADLRRLRVESCRHGRLGAMLRRRLPAGTAYVNVGHSNLSEESLAPWRGHGRVTVLVHDTIPLDHPQFQRPGTVARFEQKLRAVAEHADLVIANSAVTKADARRWFARWGQDVQTEVAHLGVDLADPAPVDRPPAPYFVTLGTIEPRKNHALLLDVWADLARECAGSCPHLVIAGARGWANEAVFARLDADRSGLIHERPGLSDGQVAGLLRGAAALLFPSHAEGFGLPAAEAAGLGTPVLASDLPVFREILGEIPIYADSADMYSWKQSILRLAEESRSGQGRRQAYPVPTWAEHFNHVLKLT